MFLGIFHVSWILMRHTLGEICWLAASLLAAFTVPKIKDDLAIQKKNPPYEAGSSNLPEV
jgi:hypothetical protein